MLCVLLPPQNVFLLNIFFWFLLTVHRVLIPSVFLGGLNESVGIDFGQLVCGILL